MEYEPILKPGDVILNGKYQVEAFLGQGAFSQVYRVQHLELKTERAVKMVSQELPGVDAATVDRFRARFRLEAQLGEQLGQPHIIHVYDFEEAEDRLYLSMDCAAGGSLAKLLENDTLSIDEAVRFTSETAAGLQALHELGIIHRDVKPSNLLLDGEGRVKVGDLGLAQVPKKLRDRSGMDSRAAAHPGTPEYMSPEQATTVGYLTPSSDVYSLGCVLFEMLTGELWREVMSRVEGVRELRPDVPVELEAVLSRMLAEEPGQRKSDAAAPSKRYVSMDAVQEALLSTQAKDVTPDVMGPELARLFEEAVIAYRWNEWERARDLLEELLHRSPGYERDGQRAEDLLADVYDHLASSPVPPRYLDQPESPKPAGVVLAAAVDLEADRDFARPVASKPTGPVSPFGSPKPASPTVPVKPVTPPTPAEPAKPVAPAAPAEPVKPARPPAYDVSDRPVPVAIPVAASAAAVERAVVAEPGLDADVARPVTSDTYDDLDALADMDEIETSTVNSQRGTTIPMQKVPGSWEEPPPAPPGRAKTQPSGVKGQFAGKSAWGKFRTIALVLFLIWLCLVTVPATALWAFNSAQKEWRVVLFPDLFGSPLPANTTPVSELESETTPEPVDQPTATEEMPTATNTAQPTRSPTPFPTVTVVVVDASAISPTVPALPPTVEAVITATVSPASGSPLTVTNVTTPSLTSPTVVTVTVASTSTVQAKTAVASALPTTSTLGTTAAVTSTQRVTGEVTTPVLWVRFGPGDNFKASAKLEVGDTVSLTGRTDAGDWLLVTTTDGVQAWANARFIQTAADVKSLAMVESPPTPTPRPTEPPPPTATPSQPTTETPPPAPAIKYPAPVLQAPEDGSAWTNGRMARNLLEWQSMNITPDEFYNITISYSRNGQETYFGDYSTTAFYRLPESLYGIADRYDYKWRVVVRKVATKSPEGKPDGPAISPESEVRGFHWE